MNNYRFRQKPTFQSYGTKTQQRLLMLALVVLLAATAVLGFLYIRTNVFESKTVSQFESKINSNLVDAIGQVSRMAGDIRSTSPMKLGQIRQHIYAMDQINGISLSVRGEAGRIVPQEAFEAIYSVLERYDLAAQTSTGNVLELRTLLLTHLMSLQELLNQGT